MPTRTAALFFLAASGLFLAALGGRFGVAAEEPVSEAAPAPVDYETQIKPLFAEHCVHCHGAELAESGLRLDAGKLAAAGGDRGAGVVPGKSSESLIYRALVGEGDVKAMPADGDRLPEEKIALVKRWIDEGAKYPADEPFEQIQQESDHWAFQPIRRPSVPSVSRADWVRNEVDAFILSRLEQEGIDPSPEADPETLIRRVSLDLRGVPPSIEEIDEYLADTEPGAYERMVDRMLASPQFGERWGRHWLDAARYADSNGFTIDSARSIWKYRDWVIAALNADMPYDEFVIEQLAGDLLPNPTSDQLVATGFHRNTLINEEGGTDDEQFRVESIVDRVNTTGQVFLGLTIGCAQCHSHKFDPISQREYYNLFAIFNNCEEPTYAVPSPEQQAELARLDAEIAAAEEPLRQHDAEFLKGLPEWEKTLAAYAGGSWTTLDPALVKTDNGAKLTELDDHSLVVDFSVPSNDAYRITADVPLDEVTAVRVEALTHASLPMGGPGRSDNAGNFVLTEFELLASAGGDAANPGEAAVSIARAVADHSQDGFPVAHAIDGKADTGWSINVAKGSLNVDREAIFFPAEPLKGMAGKRLTFVLHHDYKDPNHLLGRVRVSVSNAAPEVLAIPASILKIAATPASERTEAQQQQLIAAYQATDAGRKPLAKKVAALKRQRADLVGTIPTTMIVRELPQPRETHIHIRGDFLRPGAVVTGGVPAVLPPLPPEVTRPNRADFARWLVDPSNPLTARVAVNRVWQQLFGLGLVETENDFGTQGTPPTHPELLDWLADEYMRLGWSTKRIIRLMVTSAAYRQSSRMRGDLLERDPQNRLIARQSRLRLEAEIVRDAALAASGLLTAKIGGPSVRPPQPAGLYVVTQQNKGWKADVGPDRYRRGMYTFFWRSSPYPFLVTFDAPDANTSCTRRNRSNTPLQALTIANDEAFIEFANALGERIQREAPSDDASRIEFAFRVCLGRMPTEAELHRLAAYVAEQRSGLSGKAASSAHAKGSASAEAAAGAELESAVWAAAARVMLNLDEFITRE